ncbi:MAG: RNA polymerase sigma factor [Acidobacteriota bacterium]|nr:RNA polymerase sigma factor [Acidobacteriota bacterium]
MDLPPFQALLDSYGHDVHRFLIANVGAVDADDCYQETWIAALRGYPRLQHATNLRGWLLTIAARKAIDTHRARGRAALAMAELPEPAFDGPGRAAAGPLAGSGSGDELWDAVRCLPPKQRAALVLRFLLDAGYPAVAAAMGISEAAARRNVHEGLKRLREEHGHERTA